MKTRIWHISDTHSYHNLLKVPEDIHTVIFSGDASNYRDTARNSTEFLYFLHWFHHLDIKNKIFIGGNHDTSLEAGLFTREIIEQYGVKYLYNEGISIEGWQGMINIWGSPFTPSFGNWSFMRKRGKLAPLWETIPNNLDILVTHGPPKGVMDLTWDEKGQLQQVGDKELWNEILVKTPRWHLFGHVHNCLDTVYNQGILELNNCYTKFSNGSVVKDGKFGELTCNGNIIEI